MSKPEQESAPKPDDDVKGAIADLHARVGKLEADLKRLAAATAHITSIPGIPQ